MLTLLASRTIIKRTFSNTTTAYTPFRRYTSTMSAVNQFVADVQAADPALAGESDKDKSEIAQLSEQTEGMSKDLSVSFFCIRRSVLPGRKLTQDFACRH